MVSIFLEWLNVFPACAGMNRGSGFENGGNRCIPRMRGDEPYVVTFVVEIVAYSPHARG